MAILFVRIDACDLVNVDYRRPVRANKEAFVERLFKMIHCFVLEKGPVFCMNFYIVICSFKVKDIFYRYDFDLATVLYYDALALRWRLRSGFQQGLTYFAYRGN